MANEKRLINANDLIAEINEAISNIAFTSPYQSDISTMVSGMERVLDIVEASPTVDAVEASRLGDLVRLMMPYKGCPRGRMGARGDGRIIELDPIKDVEGDIWVPVLEEDINFLKAKAVEVVHGRWLYDSGSGKYFCSACDEYALSFKKDTLYGGDLYEVCLTDYCPNCGAKMDGDGNA